MRWVLCLLTSVAMVAPVVAAPVKKRAAAARKPAAKSQPAKKPAAPKVVAPLHPEFLRDISPILDKQGCSVAACHGKFGGRGDLQLSLLTLAPEDDFEPIVYGSRGRRVNLQDPEQSLILLKPTAQVPHAGGMRFRRGSAEYQTFLNWIKDGAPFHTEDARIKSLTVEPASSILKVGAKTQLKVTATWTDGRVEDVTKKAVYASSDEPVAAVDGQGTVTGVRWGGTAIQVRFLGNARAAFVTLPQVRKDHKPYPDVARANVIDNLVFDNLKKMNVVPSELSTDEQFCRRAFLDAIGVLPTPDELRKFVEDKATDKRAKLIDALLERPEFVDLRTLRLADMLRLNPRKISNDQGFGERSVVLFNDWIRDSVAKNRPYNQFVHELLAARGSIYFNGPATYWAIEKTANDRAETTAQAFLGVRLQCARCHKHPFDRWTTDDYWDFSAFTGKVGIRPVTGGAFQEQEVYYSAGTNVINQSVNGPHRGLPARPTLLGQPPLTEEQLKADISLKMADWVVDPSNPFFARATMNRLWSNFFGRAVVYPVDDMRETTPESVPGLLDAMSKEFVSSNYDIKHMIRLIMNSRAYQLSALPNDTNQLDDRFYAHYYPKAMLSQVLLDAINQSIGVPERLSPFPLTRSVEQPVPVANYFLDVFGRSHREYLTELDPKLEPNLVQTLHMMNSSYINGKIRNGTFTRELLRPKMGDEDVVREAFLRTLCRQPSSEEMQATLKTLSQEKSRQQWVEDLLWALLSSREFLFIS